MPLPQHSSKSNEHYTDPKLCVEAVQLAHQYTGTPNPLILDPASTNIANAFVKASKFYTKADDGLTKSWACDALFLNPPGGKIGNVSQQEVWAKKFCSAFDADEFVIGIFVCFNQGLAFRNTALWQSATAFAFHKRLHYWSEYMPGDIRKGSWNDKGKWASSPPQHSMVFVKHRRPLPATVFPSFPHNRLVLQ